MPADRPQPLDVSNLTGDGIHNFVDGMIIAAGGFLYIAASDCVPELQKTRDLHASALRVAFMLIGAGLVTLPASIGP